MAKNQAQQCFHRPMMISHEGNLKKYLILAASSLLVQLLLLFSEQSDALLLADLETRIVGVPGLRVRAQTITVAHWLKIFLFEYLSSETRVKIM